jgi:hypothetical protein
MSVLSEKTLDENTFEEEIPNETTIKAMEEDEFFFI